MTFVSIGHQDSIAYFSEASKHIKDAIELECKHRRSSQHPYSTLIHGAIDLIDHGLNVPDSEVKHVRELTTYAISRWKSDQAMEDKGNRLLKLL